MLSLLIPERGTFFVCSALLRCSSAIFQCSPYGYCTFLIKFVLGYLCLIWVSWHLTFIRIYFSVSLWMTGAERQKRNHASQAVTLEFWMWLSFDPSQANMQKQEGRNKVEILRLLPPLRLAGEVGLAQVFTAPGLSVSVSSHHLHGHEKVVAAAIPDLWTVARRFNFEITNLVTALNFIYLQNVYVMLITHTICQNLVQASF